MVSTPIHWAAGVIADTPLSADLRGHTALKQPTLHFIGSSGRRSLSGFIRASLKRATHGEATLVVSQGADGPLMAALPGAAPGAFASGETFTVKSFNVHDGETTYFCETTAVNSDMDLVSLMVRLDKKKQELACKRSLNVLMIETSSAGSLTLVESKGATAWLFSLLGPSGELDSTLRDILATKEINKAIVLMSVSTDGKFSVARLNALMAFKGERMTSMEATALLRAPLTQLRPASAQAHTDSGSQQKGGGGADCGEGGGTVQGGGAESGDGSAAIAKSLAARAIRHAVAEIEAAEIEEQAAAEQAAAERAAAEQAAAENKAASEKKAAEGKAAAAKKATAADKAAAVQKAVAEKAAAAEKEAEKAAARKMAEEAAAAEKAATRAAARVAAQKAAAKAVEKAAVDKAAAQRAEGKAAAEKAAVEKAAAERAAAEAQRAAEVRAAAKQAAAQRATEKAEAEKLASFVEEAIRQPMDGARRGEDLDGRSQGRRHRACHRATSVRAPRSPTVTVTLTLTGRSARAQQGQREITGPCFFWPVLASHRAAIATHQALVTSP